MKKYRWTGPKPALEAGQTYLSEFTDVGAVGLQRETIDSGPWSLEAYFETTQNLDALDEAIITLDPAWASVVRDADEDLPDIDWVAHALEGLGIVRAGRFVLYGVHDEARLPDEPDIIPIRIDANQAFGTGHHPTTAGCLTLLDRFAGAPPDRILDLGCGSAILAIAAAKLWDRRILAVDIDETSVHIARENAALNGVSDKLDIQVTDGVENEVVDGGAPYEFVFANILAGPLIELAPAIAARMSAPGRVMLAGLMTEQEEKVRAAYEASGFRQINRLDHETWPVLLFAKAPT